MTFFRVVSLVSVVVALAALLQSTNAECCYSYTPGICADCSDAAGLFSGYPLGACPAVKGDCNIFSLRL
ncbi:hypothetical protein Ocin01_15069 [Orchesella cincta]|uniref:Uncharacterized protein n=1 Tax=Orchesella cincta TaxID=48709 RepID=A0A1D2MFC8_ORCCI|nr:hypothetical protein Ocin01_15069 [Orchesella cincta]